MGMGKGEAGGDASFSEWISVAEAGALSGRSRARGLWKDDVYHKEELEAAGCYSNLWPGGRGFECVPLGEV